MSDPLNQQTPGKPGKEARRTTAEKVQTILGLLDLVQTVVRALLGIFGRRKEDG